MPDEKKTKRVRRTVSTQAPGPPGPTIGVDANVLSQVARDVGRVLGQNEQITQRLDRLERRVETGLKEQRDEVAQLRAENAAQHEEAANETRALGGRLSNVEGRLDALPVGKNTPPPGGASAGRKDTLGDMDKALTLGARVGALLPTIGKILAIVGAAVATWWTAVWAAKGGTPSP